jgi:hypothetical protein
MIPPGTNSPSTIAITTYITNVEYFDISVPLEYVFLNTQYTQIFDENENGETNILIMISKIECLFVSN